MYRFNDNPTIFNYSTTFNHAVAVLNWHVLALVLMGDILLLLLVEDDNTTGGRGKRHIKYFDLYIYYPSTDAVWLKNLLPMCDFEGLLAEIHTNAQLAIRPYIPKFN